MDGVVSFTFVVGVVVGCLKSLRIGHHTRTLHQCEGRISTKMQTSRPKKNKDFNAGLGKSASHASLSNSASHFKCGSE